MKYVDLNSDMGEGFGPWLAGDGVDAEIMRSISSANIATGFHAGDPSVMAETLDMAKHAGVAVGAHPGFRDMVGFGRRFMKCSPREVVNDVLYQVGALRELARARNMKLQHVKPHGALYMHVAQDEDAAELLVSQLAETDPDLKLYLMHGSLLHRKALDAGIPVICEFYADREYDNSGSIVFIRKTQRPDPQQLARRVLRACMEHRVKTVEGDDIELEFSSVCIHSDTPGALQLINATRTLLINEGISVSSPDNSQ